MWKLKHLLAIAIYIPEVKACWENVAYRLNGV